jgi:hypothetical protein
MPVASGECATAFPARVPIYHRANDDPTDGAEVSGSGLAENGHMTPADVSRLAAELEGVAERSRDGLLEWRYRGRLVARQLDQRHIVIRASFDFRDFLLHSFPDTFSVPRRFAKHMMVVADLENGNAEIIEDAVIGAWELQSGK